MLIRAKVQMKRSSKRPKHGYSVCRKLCMACPLAGVGPGKKIDTHKCLKTGQSWNITSTLDCQSANVIYKLSCKKPNCSWVYIGETSRKFCQRLTDHRGYIHRKDLSKPAGHHFNQKGHSIQDLQAYAFEKVLPIDNMLRKQRESMWISRYDSISLGANNRD